MVKFHLAIAEHEEYGCNGIIIKSQSRKYFDPTLSGLTLAHDLLEHPVTPHRDGYVDELMALGSIIAGRIEYGWINPTNRYSYGLTLKNLVSDISSLCQSAFQEKGNFNIEKCNSYIQDKGLMAEIRTTVRKGILEAMNEDSDEVYTYIPEEYDIDIDSMVGHIAKGYQLFRRRFNHLGYNFIYLFDEISRQADKFMKHSEVDQEAILTVDFKNSRVYLDEFYGDY